MDPHAASKDGYTRLLRCNCPTPPPPPTRPRTRAHPRQGGLDAERALVELSSAKERCDIARRATVAAFKARTQCRTDMERAKSEIQLAVHRHNGNGRRGIKANMDAGGERKLTLKSPPARSNDLFPSDAGS